MATKTMTLRLPADQARELETLARIETLMADEQRRREVIEDSVAELKRQVTAIQARISVDNRARAREQHLVIVQHVVGALDLPAKAGVENARRIEIGVGAVIEASQRPIDQIFLHLFAIEKIMIATLIAKEEPVPAAGIARDAFLEKCAERRDSRPRANHDHR